MSKDGAGKYNWGGRDNADGVDEFADKDADRTVDDDGDASPKEKEMSLEDWEKAQAAARAGLKAPEARSVGAVQEKGLEAYRKEDDEEGEFVAAPAKSKKKEGKAKGRDNKAAAFFADPPRQSSGPPGGRGGRGGGADRGGRGGATGGRGGGRGETGRSAGGRGGSAPNLADAAAFPALG
mmetsp:Transcript_22134/g.52595  ORF Transcript_22134/g.52595 Transcript_22134/m.52595 type:complete len:180 (-) Transcript_22134:93-632(-)